MQSAGRRLEGLGHVAVFLLFLQFTAESRLSWQVGGGVSLLPLFFTEYSVAASLAGIELCHWLVVVDRVNAVRGAP